MEAEELPKSTREMLAGMVMMSLNKLQEDRHEHQAKVVEMVATTLTGVEAAMRKAIEDAGVLVSNADAERTTRAANLASAQAKLESKKSEVQTLTTAHNDAKTAAKDASHSHTNAVHAQTDGDEELRNATARKDRMEAALRDDFLPLKEGAITEKASVKKMVASLVAVAKEHHMDASLMHAIGVTLGKEPGTRGEFDNTSLQHFEDDFKRRIADMAEKTQSLTSASEERAAASKAALEAHEAAKETQAARAAAVKKGHDEQKACESDVKAADKAVQSLEPEIEAASDAVSAAEHQLETFQNGALANFLELKDRCAPPPAPPTPPDVPDVTSVPAEVSGTVALD
jgi:chromosome segregation ATPase